MKNFNSAELRDVLQINLIPPPDRSAVFFYHPFWINAELDDDSAEENLRLGATCHDDARDFDHRINEITACYRGIKLGAFFRDRDLHGGLRGGPWPRSILNNGALVGILSIATSRLILKYYFNGSLACRLC